MFETDATAGKLRAFVEDLLGVGRDDRAESFFHDYYIDAFHLDRLLTSAADVLRLVQPGYSVADLGGDGVLELLLRHVVRGVEVTTLNILPRIVKFDERGLVTMTE